MLKAKVDYRRYARNPERLLATCIERQIAASIRVGGKEVAVLRPTVRLEQIRAHEKNEGTP